MSDKFELEKELNDCLKNANLNLKESSIDNMSLQGKVAFFHYLYESSEFRKHSSIVENVHKFAIDTSNDIKIYHYTTNESLKNILDSKYFRIKSYNYMNDTNEFKWASIIAVKHLSSIGADKHEIEAFENKVKKPPFKYCYIWSFTENSDSQNLFGSYGNKSGLALEFSLQNIMRKLSTINANGKNDLDDFSQGDGYVFPLHVEYNKKVQEEYVYAVADEWLRAYRSFEDNPNYMAKIMLICEKNMFMFNLCFKNPLLYQEEEVRFLIIKVGKERNVIDLEVDGIDYTKCPIDTNMINTIKIQTGNDISELDLKRLLSKYNLNTKIIRSELPY